MKLQLFEQFLQYLQEAISEITPDYFDVEIFGGNSKKRERHYCYELYRLIRNKVDGADFPYMISGEIDKTGHPLISEKCGNINPDFIVHRQGQMGIDDNLAIIEVKTSEGNLGQGLLKDIATLRCMTTIDNGYYKGIFIISGVLSDNKLDGLKNNLSIYAEDMKGKLIIIHHKAINDISIISY